MKKLLGVLILMVVGVVGTAHWQLRRAQTALAAGATLQFGGVQFDVPPLTVQRTGWFPPALEVGDVEVGLKLAQLTPVTLVLRQARLAIDLLKFGPRLESAVLEIKPAGLDVPADITEVHGFAFALSPATRLTGVTARRVIFSGAAPAAEGSAPAIRKPEVEFADVELTYIPGPSFVPAQVGMRIGAITVLATQAGDPEKAAMSGFEFQLTSTEGKPMRSLQLYFGLQGMQSRWVERESPRALEVKPLAMKATARMRELSADEWQRIIDTLQSKIPNWSQLEQQDNPQLQVNLLLSGMFDMLLSTGIVPETTTLSWEGMVVADGKGAALVQMQPSQWSASFVEDPKGVQAEVTGTLGNITFAGETNGAHGAISDVQMQSKATYAEPTYAGLVQGAARNAQAATNLNTRAGAAAYLTQMLAQWGSPMNARFTLGRIDVTTPDNTTSLRNGQWQLSQDRTTLRGEVTTDVVAQTLPPGLPAKQIENGKARLSMGVITPWQAWQALAKKTGGGEFPLVQFLEQCVRQTHGLELGIDADAGNLGFAAHAQAKLMVDGATLAVKAEGNPETVLGRVVDAIPTTALQAGHLTLDVQIDHVSALQKVIDAVSPGTSDGLLAQVQPFAKFEQDKDTLSTKITMANGKWNINGQAQPMLDALTEGALDD